MHSTTLRTAVAAALAILVAACGSKKNDGNGGDDTTIAVSFAEASAAARTYAGQPTPAEVALHVSLSRAPAGALVFGLAGAEGAFVSTVRTEPISTSSFRVYLTPRTDISQGAHSGTLTLLLCGDAACTTPYEASGNTLPFAVTVDAGLSVSVQVGGAEKATATPGASASVSVESRATVELAANATMAWSYEAAADGVQVAVASGSAPTAWKATLTLPFGVDAASVVLTGSAKDGSDGKVTVTLAATRAPIAGAYATGVYPNLFHELLGKSDAEIQAKIAAAWNQYFDPGNAETLFYLDAGDASRGFVEDVNNKDIRSEGMSYGMMIAVQLDHQDVFDKLWRFAKKYSLYASGPWQGYFAWQLEAIPPYSVLGASNASDGEEWYATALLMAANRWGNGGAFDYRADAQAILDTLLHKHEQPDRGSVTDMFDATTHQVVFVASGASATFTDPSYHLPHFYELWAAWADKDQRFWCEAAAASRAFLPTTANATTGLAPDYARFDGAPYDTPYDSDDHKQFRYDAFRVGANIGVDHAWFQRDPWQTTEGDRLLGFFHGKGADYTGLWTVTGVQVPGGSHNAGLVATNAAAALASGDASLRREFVQALWNAPAPTGQYRYYDGMLYTLALLQVSGNFRVYHPGGVPAATCP